MNNKQMQAIQRFFAQQKQQESGLIEFKCGRCFMDDTTKMVTSDDKRGTLKFYKNETGFLQMDWIDRISKEKGLTLTLFPKTAKWERVDDCKDGRVYLLRLIDSNRKHFFWMQEPDDDNDINDNNNNNNDNNTTDKSKKNKPDKYQIWFEQINWLCDGKAVNDNDDSKKNNNNTSGGGVTNPLSALSGVTPGVGGNNPMSGFNNQMFVQQQQQILASLQGGGSGTGNSGNNNVNSGNSNNNMANMILQAMRGGIGNTGNNNVNTNVVQQLQNELKEQAKNRAEKLKKEPDLEDILNPTVNKDEINAVLDDEKVLESLAQNLPEGMRSREAIIEQLESPQFQGALRRLQSAVNGPSMDMILMQMGIPQNNNNNSQDNIGVSAFIQAIIDKHGDTDAKNDDNNDTNMDDQKDNNPNKPPKTGDDNASGNNNNNNNATDNDVEMSDLNKKPQNPPNPGKKT